MSSKPKVGDTVEYIGCSPEQVAWGNCDRPIHCIVGRKYTVERVEEHSQHTKIELRNMIGKFNSVCFAVQTYHDGATDDLPFLGHAKPIKGRPKLVEPKVAWDTYSTQRRNRLADCVNDYLNDDDVTARQFYEELLHEIDDSLQYHKRNYDKILEAKNLVLGHRFCDDIACSDSFGTAE